MEEVISAEKSSQSHVLAILTLLDQYAQDDAGGVQLSESAKNDLVAELCKRQNAHVVLSYIDGTPAGMAICFEVPSVWPLKPKLSVYDFIVTQTYRGRGLSQRMLAKAEKIAIQSGCSKLMVEV
jgi:GNAT superfamily N-acetyltransferase